MLGGAYSRLSAFCDRGGCRRCHHLLFAYRIRSTLSFNEDASATSTPCRSHLTFDEGLVAASTPFRSTRVALPHPHPRVHVLRLMRVWSRSHFAFDEGGPPRPLVRVSRLTRMGLFTLSFDEGVPPDTTTSRSCLAFDEGGPASSTSSRSRIALDGDVCLSFARPPIVAGLIYDI